jgi:hypothetical protein
VSVPGPPADARRAAVVALLMLLAGGGLLTVLPDFGPVRVVGVGLAWWYGVLAAPALATLVAVSLGAAAASRASVAAWLSPALVAALAAGVFRGDPGAPLLVLLAVLAPLLGLLASRRAAACDGVTGALGVASVALVASSGLLVGADLTRSVGGDRWPGVVIAAALAAGSALRPVPARRRPAILGLALAALATPVVAAAAAGATPWAAWRELASRPALVFSERSVGVTDGVRLRAPTTLVFTEPHRITAVSGGIWHVVEQDADRVTVREWRLAPGDALTLRPGDRLDLAADSTVRFEAGRRVPGVALSGVAWADPPEREPVAAVATFAGAALTLAGAAALLVSGAAAGTAAGAARGSGARAAAATAPLVIGVIAACWGVLGAHAAPELALGAPEIAPFVRLPQAVPGPPWDRPLVAAALLGLGALFVVAVSEMRDRALTLLGGLRRPNVAARALGAAGVAVALLLFGRPAGAWEALALGSGLAASAVIAPALAQGGLAARRAGALAGAAAYIVMTVGASSLLAWAPAVGAYPALLAAPLAAGAAALRDRAGAPTPIRRRRRTRSVAAGE